jgi:N,N'-diacetyllegionaminate synthase
MNHVFIIAEAGVNHNGSIELAKKLVDEAKKVGADAVKFQTFKAEYLVSKFAQKAQYQKETTNKNESQYDMIKKLELSFSDFVKLKEYCEKSRITFLSSAFDLESIDFLISIGMEIFKIPSGEITNLPYIEKIGKLSKRVILSTGMASIGEIDAALDVLVKSGTSIDNITVLHCNTEYPTPYSDVNLRAMVTIKNAFNVKVGYSDHTDGIEVPIAAVALGAEVIEKHFTLDKDMEGPDHQASLEPDDLYRMIQAIRNVELALGDGIKRPSESEKKNISITRKSIVAKRSIKKGEVFTCDNLTVKRPGNGISPMRWYEIIGTVAQKEYSADDLICREKRFV